MVRKTETKVADERERGAVERMSEIDRERSVI